MSLPENVTENWSSNFQDNQFQADKIYIYYLVNKIKTTGSVLDKMPDRNRNVLTEEILDDTVVRLETSLRKFLRLHGNRCFENIYMKSQKMSRLQSYQTMVVHALKVHDQVARIHFCNCFLWSVHWSTISVFFFLKNCRFPYTEKWIPRTVSIGMQKIQELFMNFFCMMTKVVFGEWKLHAG